MLIEFCEIKRRINKFKLSVNGIKEENPGLEESEYSNLLILIKEFETALKGLNTTLDAVNMIRDTTIAHIDKKHINNPNALLISNNPLWDEILSAYSLVGSGLDEIGKYFGLVSALDFVTLANHELARKTKLVFDFLYSPKAERSLVLRNASNDKT